MGRLSFAMIVLGASLGFATAALVPEITLLPGPPSDLGPAWSVPGPRPVAAVHATVDTAALRELLSDAPLERVGTPLATYGMLVHLPHPSGVLMPCYVAISPVMEPALAAKFPMMRTYLVQSADGLASGRIELTQRGLTGMLREPADLGQSGGTWMIDLWRSGDDSNVVAYWLRDLNGANDWTCHTHAGLAGEIVDPAPIRGGAGGDGASRALQARRNVRTAIACTGEYGLHHSTIQGNEPNSADPMAAIVTIVSRSNVVFEMDLGVHFDLVANNDLIVYFDPATDPYPDTCDGLGGSDCSGPVLSVNRTHVPDVIGSANFDLGHCVTRIAGGVAYLRSVCTSNKAGGISGIPRGGDADPFSALVVIHEFGHQFGANHTFSGTRGRCGNNANLATAWEAGTGSSPMGYAGGCPVGDAPPSDNIVQFADPWFHHGSVLEMRAFLDSGTASCMSPVATTNNIPEITFRTADTAIPPGTPFVLSATATDADNDTLTYSWEQRDDGVRRPLTGEGSEDNGQGALFRIFPPVLDGSRTFPQWSDILSGVPTPGEKLPTATNATRRFRVIVRDNSPGAGGVAISGTADLVIPSNASPFTVVTPASGQSLGAGAATVAWTVGNTNLAPISCTQVAIDLSTDDGLSFPISLGTYPNNGSAVVDLPAVSSPGARVRVRGVSRIFFNVSGSFTLAGCAADFNMDGIPDVLDFLDFMDAFGSCDGQPAPCSGSGGFDADLNGDTIIDIIDFLDFMDAFGSGC
ncbi:MAG: hypothetical protein KF902_01055 [Phycisphaeraceae bacterium]|nr:hypothetical protein [Phycisphaeraceae bacterium]